MVFHYWVLLDVLPCRFYHIKHDSEVLFDILFSRLILEHTAAKNPMQAFILTFSPFICY